MLTLLADLTPTGAVFLGVGTYAAPLVPFYLFVDGDTRATDFDPRPAVRRAVESGRFDALLIAVGPALHDTRRACRTVAERARRAPRDAAITVAALLMLLTSPEGANR